MKSNFLVFGYFGPILISIIENIMLEKQNSKYSILLCVRNKSWIYPDSWPCEEFYDEDKMLKRLRNIYEQMGETEERIEELLSCTYIFNRE